MMIKVNKRQKFQTRASIIIAFHVCFDYELGLQYWDVLVVLFTNVMGGRGGEGGGREIDNGVAADRYRLEYRKVDYCLPSLPTKLCHKYNVSNKCQERYFCYFNF